MSKCNRVLSAHNRRYFCCLQVGNPGPKQDKQELCACSSQEDWLPPAQPPKGHVSLSTTHQASAAGEGPVQKACPMSVPRQILLLSVLLLLLLSRFSCVQLCATPIDGSPPGSPVSGILQARTLEWVAISSSNT